MTVEDKQDMDGVRTITRNTEYDFRAYYRVDGVSKHSWLTFTYLSKSARDSRVAQTKQPVRQYGPCPYCGAGVWHHFVLVRIVSPLPKLYRKMYSHILDKGATK